MSELPLEITVVYDGSGKRRGTRRVAAKSVAGIKPRKVPSSQATSSRIVSPGRTRQGGAALVLLSLLTLCSAGGLTYATWWPADKFIFEAFILRTPIPGMDIDQVAATMFGGLTAKRDKGKSPATNSVPVPRASAHAAANLDEAAPPMFTGTTATNIIAISAYAWLTISTVACCLLSLSAGAGAVGARRRGFRILGWLGSLAAAGALAYGAYVVWQEFGTRFPTDYLRWGMAGLVGLAFFLGCAIAPSARKALKMSGFALLGAAVCTIICLCLGRLSGAVEPYYCSPVFLGTAFAAHSAWAWILLLLAPRLAHGR